MRCYCGQCGPVPDDVKPTPCHLADLAVRRDSPCEDCQGKGWEVFNDDPETGQLGNIERCDTCKALATDTDAEDAARAAGYTVGSNGNVLAGPQDEPVAVCTCGAWESGEPHAKDCAAWVRPAKEFIIEVNKYAHAGSGATRELARFPTREKADTHADIARATRLYRFVVVREA